MIDLKQSLTDKIENIVNNAIQKMPENATHITLIEGYRQASSGGFLKVTNCWTEVDAIYKDKNEHEITRIQTIGKGGWQYSEPANYILYHMGLHKPYNTEKLRTIKARYDWDLDHNRIYPIKKIISDNYKIRNIVNNIIQENNTDNNVNLTFVLDYDYMENNFSPNVKYDTRPHSIKARITSNNKNYTFKDCKNFFDITMILEESYLKLKEHNIPVTINYDMDTNDWNEITRQWNKLWEKN